MAISINIKAIAANLFLLASCYVQAQVTTTVINPDIQYQTIDHFTASDAWSGPFVGQYWDNDSKEQIARWLFCSEFDETGNPQGIGLSLWRVNLGAGTLEQEKADIEPFHRRVESFMSKDGKSYDWKKCAGQQYFMQKAVEYGCNNFLLFSNSPLVQYTKNGKGYSDSYDANLKPDCYGKFADYLATVAAHFQNEKGWNIRYISPINEPQIDWINNRQEGTPWKASQMKQLYVELDKALSKKKLKQTEILVAEASCPQMLTDKDEWLNDKFTTGDIPHNLIENFFGKESPNYIGDLKHVHALIGGHAYSSHNSNAQIIETREKIKEATSKYGISYQQTEWCMLPGLKDPMDGFKEGWARENYANMPVALQMARLIHGDLVYADATAWGYWKGMELKGNHALISLYANDGNIINGGSVRSNKLLWALGNYSLFIRNGYIRIQMDNANDLNSLAGSAYQSADGKTIVAVYVNSSFNDIPVNIVLPKQKLRHMKTRVAYRTSAQMDLAKLPTSNDEKNNDPITMASRSITTVVFQF